MEYGYLSFFLFFEGTCLNATVCARIACKLFASNIAFFFDSWLLDAYIHVVFVFVRSQFNYALTVGDSSSKVKLLSLLSSSCER